jgi:hypothetical protein
MDAADLDELRVILNAPQLHKVYEFPDGIEFGVLNNDDAEEATDIFPVVFFPRGDSTGGKIVLKNLRRRQYSISVDRITGTVEVARL